MFGLITGALANTTTLPCVPGTAATGEVTRHVVGRTHGTHIERRERIDRPIDIRQQQRVTLRCLDAATAEVSLTVARPDGGWAGRSSGRRMASGSSRPGGCSHRSGSTTWCTPTPRPL